MSTDLGKIEGQDGACMTVTAYAGGRDAGRCVQLTVDRGAAVSYVGLTVGQAAHLIDLLRNFIAKDY